MTHGCYICLPLQLVWFLSPTIQFKKIHTAQQSACQASMFSDTPVKAVYAN